MALASFAGCSKPEPTVAVVAAAPFTSVPIAASEKRAMTASVMVSPDEMAAILGAVVAKGHGDGQCIFSAVNSPSPHAELMINGGDGEIAMKSVGMMNRHEPGIVDPLAGLGDQAAQIGPAFMVRSDKDLVTIVFSGVDDVVPKAHRIFETAKARM